MFFGLALVAGIILVFSVLLWGSNLSRSLKSFLLGVMTMALIGGVIDVWLIRHKPVPLQSRAPPKPSPRAVVPLIPLRSVPFGEKAVEICEYLCFANVVPELMNSQIYEIIQEIEDEFHDMARLKREKTPKPASFAVVIRR